HRGERAGQSPALSEHPLGNCLRCAGGGASRPRLHQSGRFSRPCAGLERCRPTKEASIMANPAPVGSDVSAGTYQCTNCGHELKVQSVESLPPCPKCDGPNEWEAV